MLDIFLNYHPMQFPGKLMKQTWENGKKFKFGPDFGPFGPNLGSQSFFWTLPLLLIGRHCLEVSSYAI